jgi:ribosomal protein S27AE
MSRLVRLLSGVRRSRPLRLAAGGAGVVAIAATVAALAAQQPDFRSSPFLRIDPERIVLDEQDTRVPCGECHEAEYEVWRETDHALGFDRMHRTDAAQEILDSMGLITAKRQESLCMRCHYTVGPELGAIAGVSCESCHGPARDWVGSHNQYGEGVTEPDDETAEHRQQRIEQSVQNGMLRPSGDLYAVAANCFECHTVPMEELVNKGGHTTGTARFDLIENVDSIRHNFLHLQWTNEGGNRPPTPERRRLMFAIGRMLAYEFALRGVAAATTDARYFKAMHRGVQQTQRELDAVARVIDEPAIRDALVAGNDLRLEPGNGAALLAAADRIRAAGQRFAQTADGARLAALDPLIAGGAPPVAGAPAAGAGDAQPPAQPPTGATVTGTPPATPPPATPPPATPPPATPPPAAAALPALPGRVRTRPEWFPEPDPRYLTIIEGCGCHDRAEEWNFADEHAESVNRLRDMEPRAVEIATLYGIDPETMDRGDRICTSCHATVPSAAPTAEAFDGVLCERCHGPSSGYLDPHEDGGNPQLGMVALKDAAVRARTCAGCHRISDERLLAADHPSGSDYDIVAAMEGIVHFPDGDVDRNRTGSYPEVADATLRSAYEAVAAARPIPRVTPVALPAGASAAALAPPAAADRRARIPAGQVESAAVGGPSLPPRPPATRRPRASVAAPGSIDIEPLPSGLDTSTSEELLLVVKRRLERLYAQLGRGR